MPAPSPAQPAPQARRPPLRAHQPALGARSAAVAAARRLRRASQRRAHGRFLVEGPQAVGAALAAGGLVEVFVGEGSRARFADLLERAAHSGGVPVPVRVLTDAAVASLSETVSPQGLVGVADLPRHRLADLVRPRLIAVCVAAGDPGNAGTLVRTADAAGADAVVFAGSGVDPFGGKCVRACAGSIFHLPVVVLGDGCDLDGGDGDGGAAGSGQAAGVLARLRALGCEVIATSAGGSVDLDAAEAAGILAAPTAWVFGNEAHGLPGDWLVSADAVVRVPVYGQAESLNLAVASALCLYASARAQRMAGSGTWIAGGGGPL
jgi:TrmH family RNA methyltransferase